MKDESKKKLPFIRITVLGPKGSGKTSLINCFVNNCFNPRYIATLAPSLYYRVVQLPQEYSSTDVLDSVCVEIEDTCNVQEWNNSNDHLNTKLFNSPDLNNEDSHEPISNLDFFFDMSTNNIFLPDTTNNLIPFSHWKAPSVPIGTHLVDYTPLTQGRMAFLITFDLNSRFSFHQACEIYQNIILSLEKQKIRIAPYIVLIGTKMDKNNLVEVQNDIIQQANIFSQRYFIHFFKVSALSSKNVRRAFWNLINLIVGNQMLWEIDIPIPGTTLREVDENKNDNCNIV